MEYQKRLARFRQKMEEKNLDAYIIYSADPHKSVAVADHWRSVRWFSGFTGWVGTLVVTRDKVAFWTDGRYVEQAARELEGKEILQFCILDPEAPSLETWLAGELDQGARVGFDGDVLMTGEYRRLKQGLLKKHPRLIGDSGLVKELWTDRPPVPRTPVFDFALEYAGMSRRKKLALVRGKMEQQGADYYLCCGLDDIAWVTNLRGGDSPLYPVFHGYFFLSMSEAWLFTEPDKLTEEIRNLLLEDGIRWKSPQELGMVLEGVDAHAICYLDPWKTSISLSAHLAGTDVSEGMDLITGLKCRKNPTELENLERANEKEAVSVVRLIRYVKSQNGKVSLDEYGVGQWINRERKHFPEYLHPGNVPIVGCRGNATRMHYMPTPEHSDVLPQEGFLLFDLCAHYLQGSTDITRTISLGKLTRQMREDYTLVLKSHIQLAMQKFPYGCTGPLLDSIVKSSHWNRGMNYDAGTGHGMGYCTYIQEGPCKIAVDKSPFFHYTFDAPVEPGMIFSNEPGIYRKGSHAIRLENTVAAVDAFRTEYGRFLGFRTLTYIPFEREAIVAELLTGEELEWLNHYHQETYRRLSPYLSEEECTWLREQTEPVSGISCP